MKTQQINIKETSAFKKVGEYELQLVNRENYKNVNCAINKTLEALTYNEDAVHALIIIKESGNSRVNLFIYYNKENDTFDYSWQKETENENGGTEYDYEDLYTEENVGWVTLMNNIIDESKNLDVDIQNFSTIFINF